MLTSGLLLISTGSSRIFHWYFLCALKISTLSLLIGGGFAGPGWAQSRITCDLSCTGTVIENATDNNDSIAEDGVTSDSSSFTATTEDQELIYGVYRVRTDSEYPNYAVWQYEIDNDDPQTNALGAGQTGTDRFTVTAADGGSVTVTITVTGADDAAVIGGDLTGSAIEDDTSAQTATGTVTVSDPDSPTTITTQTTNGTYGSLVLRADGTWTYTLDNTLPATNALAQGATVTDSFSIATSDGSTATISITVTGADDASVIGGTLTGSVTEDGTSEQTTATGTVTVSDPDSPTTITAQTASGTYGSLVLRADGTWTYTLDNTLPATNALAQGATVTDSFRIETSDGSTAISITVTVTGADDASVIGGTLTGSVTEDDTQTATGTVTVSDPDSTTTITTQTTSGTYGSLVLRADRTWTYTLDNTLAATNALAEGATVTDSFRIETSDESTATISITVMGTNDAAVISGTLTGSVIEDGTSEQTTATGTVTLTDVDGTNAVRQNSNIVGIYGTLAITSSDGKWTYTLDNTLPATNALAEGATATDTLTILAADGTEGTLTITVTGAGDPGLIEGTLRGAVTEDDISASSASGTVMVTDVDGATITAQTSDGTYGSFSIDTDGIWTYTLNNDDPDTDALTRGETGTETFTIMASDGTTATVTITVTGASMSVAGVMVTPQALEVTETAGESQADVYTMVLRELPSGDVIITPKSADPSVATVSGGPLVFRQDNWYQPQSVTVTGVDDTVVEPDGRMTEITHNPSFG